MRQEQNYCIRYSTAFKQKIVSEIEAGEITIAQAQKIYGINGKTTIQAWIKRLGKNHLLCRVVRIEMKDEQDRIKRLQKHIQKLESALANAHIKNAALESLIECAEEYYRAGFKKNFGGKQLQEDKEGQKA